MRKIEPVLAGAQDEQAWATWVEIHEQLDEKLATSQSWVERGVHGEDAERLLASMAMMWPERPDVAELLDRARRLSASSATLLPSRWKGKPKSDLEGLARSFPEIVRWVGECLFSAAVERLARQDRPDAKALLQQVRHLEDLYNQAGKSYRAKRTAEALRILKELQQMEDTLYLRGSRLDRFVRRRSADMYYVEGVAAYSGGGYRRARDAFAAALKSYPAQY